MTYAVTPVRTVGRELSTAAATALHIQGSSLSDGPLGRVGLELEAHCIDLVRPQCRPDWDRIQAVLAELPPLPGRSSVTVNARSDYDRPETIEETARLVDELGGIGVPAVVDHLVHDEVGQLAAAFNRFVERIQSVVSQVGETSHQLLGAVDRLHSLSEHADRQMHGHGRETDQVVTAVNAAQAKLAQRALAGSGSQH